MAARTAKATTRAANRLGKIVRGEAIEAFAKVLGVPATAVRRITRAQAAFRRSKTPRYTVWWLSSARIPVRRSKHTRFEPYNGSPRGQGQRGQLTVRHWQRGRRTVLEGVVRAGRGRGAGYGFVATDSAPARGVGGPRITRGSRPSRTALDPIRRGLRKRFARELRRQLRMVRR